MLDNSNQLSYLKLNPHCFISGKTLIWQLQNSFFIDLSAIIALATVYIDDLVYI